MENLSELIRTSQELLLISAQDNQKISLLDPKTLAPIEIFQDDTAPSKHTLQISNKFGHILAFQQTKQILNIWNFNQKRLFLRIHVPERLTATCISNSELYFIGGTPQGNLYIWHTLTGQLIKKFKASQKKINKICISKDDSCIIIGGEDGIINVYKSVDIFSENNSVLQDMQRNQGEIRAFQQLLGHTCGVSDMVVGEGGRLYSGGRDKQIIVWDFQKGAKLAVFGCESEVKCIAVHFSQQWVYAGCSNGKIYVNRVHQDAELYEMTEQQTGQQQLQQKKWKNKVLEGHRGEVECLDIYQEQNLLVSGSKDGAVFFWNSEGQVQKKYSFYNSAICNIKLISRPKEFSAINSTTTQTTLKRTVLFKPFSKFELTQQFLQSKSAEGQGAKNNFERFIKADGTGVTKKIKKNNNNKGEFVKGFFKAHMRMVSKNGVVQEVKKIEEKAKVHEQEIEGKNVEEKEAEEFSVDDIKELIKQNKFLKQNNHELFTAYYKLNEFQEKQN